jgi:hypothetical protein
MTPVPARGSSTVIERTPEATLSWLQEPDDPAVAVLTRRALLDEPESPDMQALWALRNAFGPIVAILEAKGEPSKWLTLRALTVLRHFGG